MRISLLLPAFVFTVHAAPLASQQLAPVPPGTRVRVSSIAAGLDRQQGTIVFISGDTMQFRPNGCHAPCAVIPLAGDAVDRVEVFTGRSHAKGAAVGGLVGAVVGAAVSLGTDSRQTCEGGLGAIGACASQAFAGAMATIGLFTLAGTALGAAIGVGDTWRDIQVGPPSVRVGFGLAGPRRAGVVLSAAF